MEEKQLQQEVQVLDEQVKALVISDKETFETAGSLVHGLTDLKKKIEEYFKPMKDAAYKAHKEITGKEKAMLKPVEDKLRTLKGKLNYYLTEQEKKRQEEQRKLDEQRRKAEEAERKRLEARAQRAEASGKLEKAEALREQADDVFVTPAVVQPEVGKTTRMDTGTVSTVNDIELSIVSPMEIIKAVASGSLPLAMVEIKEAKLRKYIKDFQIESVPGCSIKHIKKAQFRGNN